MSTIIPLSEYSGHRRHLRISDSEMCENRSVFRKKPNPYYMPLFAFSFQMGDRNCNIADITDKHKFPLSLVMAYNSRVIFSLAYDTYFKSTNHLRVIKDLIDLNRDDYVRYFEDDENGSYIDFNEK